MYRNSQEYHYAYRPELRLREGGPVHEMHVEIENRRSVSPLDYMYMCHIHWLAVEGSRPVRSAPRDPEHVTVSRTDPAGDSPRATALRPYSALLEQNPGIAHDPASQTQVYDQDT